MGWVFISPHFDDAVLSCGGLIWEYSQAGIPVEIWTVTAGEPAAGPVSGLITRIHTKWKTGSPAETVALRRIEDQKAAQMVGACVRHLGLVDAIYRRTNNGLYLYTEDVFDPIHPEESGIIEETARLISRELKASDTLVCPLALGGHVDHVIVRAAIESLDLPIFYYTDIPYLFEHQDELPAATSNMISRHISVSTEGLAAWQDGIDAYESQLSSLFLDSQEMRNLIQDYCSLNHGQLIWKKL